MTSADYQRQVYAKEGLWKAAQGKQGEQERAQVIFSLLPSQVHSVLDAGCGSGILANAVESKFVVGLDRSKTALMYVQTNKIEGDLIALPFAGYQFEAALCSEVLEHIPYPIFDNVLSELTRVTSQFIVVSVPWKQVLGKVQVLCPACKCRFQPHYHMRSFDECEMEKLFQGHGFKIRKLTTAGYKKPAVGLNTLLRRLKLQQFPAFTVCPQCGYQRQTVVAQKDSLNGSLVPPPDINSTNRKKELGKMIRQYWPRLKGQPRWWVALYEHE